MNGIRWLGRPVRRHPTEIARRATPNKLRSAGGLLVVLAALALPMQALAGVQVPLKGSDGGGFGPGDHSCTAGFGPLDIDGTGNLTQLGKYTYHADECFNEIDLVFSGSFTMTAANGDTLFGTYAGTVPPIDFPLAVYRQRAEIVGGTGRFAGASGEFNVIGLANLGTGEYSQRISGTVSSPGEAKH